MKRTRFYIRELKYKLRTRIQRFMRGYSDVDVWNMDTWFMEVIEPMLSQLRNGYSYPCIFNSHEEWHDVLTEMIECLHLMNEDNVEESLGFVGYEGILKMKAEDHEKVTNIMFENKNRFFELFNKYFYDLWD